jgi:hypothetical protein
MADALNRESPQERFREEIREAETGVMREVGIQAASGP